MTTATPEPTPDPQPEPEPTPEPEPQPEPIVESTHEATPSARPDHAHNLDRADVDLALLSEELAGRLGRPVAVTAAELVDGSRYVVLHDPTTGDDLNVDGRTVAGAIRAHQPPPTPEQEREQRIADAEAKAAAGDTAGALVDVLALLRSTPGAA